MSDTYSQFKEDKSEIKDGEGSGGYGTHEQTKSRAENKVDLGNEKKQEGEVLDKVADGQPRKAESPEARKNFTIGHEEELHAADLNLFGNGETGIDHLVKPGWED